MSKRPQVRTARMQRRIFPTDYTRNDLIRYATRLGAENHEQAEEIEALAQRVRGLEARLDAHTTASLRATRFHAPDSLGACLPLTAPAPSEQHRQKAQ
ncbi:hypothetical protein [Paraburkholderia kururiensis]|uniref:hypothetical protein n=1 Tax=Paraburkholderia kururiensis TaxID=984307 RepID=UPI000AC851AE|nr:hypothetical protein [Paraburkholderia kururiensis]